MTPEIETAEYAGGYSINLMFSDGVAGTVNLESELWGEVFEPLKDVQVFRQFYIHPEFRTVCWPNGADFAPEFLYEVAAQQVARADA
jgi:hypothetical protein